MGGTAALQQKIPEPVGSGNGGISLFCPVVVVDVVVFLGFQIADAFVNVGEELFLISGEGGCQADVVGYMVASENHVFRFRQVQVFHNDLQFFHKAIGGEGE